MAGDNYAEILLQEKAHWTSELLDYNKRLDRTPVLYLTAAYAAIGLQASGKLDLSEALRDDRYVWLAFLFIFLNGCILLHATAQSCWCMGIAKFLHLNLDEKLLARAGQPAQADRCKADELRSVGPLDWDDWRTDVKGVGNAARGAVFLLWTALVIASSILSLLFVNLPRFLEGNAFAGWAAVVVLSLQYGYFFVQFLWEAFFVTHCHERFVNVSCATRCVISVLALVLIILFVTGGYLAARHQNVEKANNAVTTSSASGIHSSQGANAQP